MLITLGHALLQRPSLRTRKDSCSSKTLIPVGLAYQRSLTFGRWLQNHSLMKRQATPLQSTVPKKMATGTFTHNSKRTKSLKTPIKTQRKVLKTLNLAYTMLYAQGQIYAKNMAFYVPIGCARFARHCGKMYTCHLFPYGGFSSTRTFLVLQKIPRDL